MCVAKNKTSFFLLKWEKVSKIKCPKQNFKIVFILFKIISELENIKQDDVKDEAKEKHFKTELLDLEEAPQYQTTEAMMLLEKSAEAKGKLNPIKAGPFLGGDQLGGYHAVPPLVSELWEVKTSK